MERPMKRVSCASGVGGEKIADGRKKGLPPPGYPAYKAPPDAVAANEAPTGREHRDNLALAVHSSKGLGAGCCGSPEGRGILDIVDTVL
ncbi:hypothetical protein GAY28_11565 [Azospirillum brasilense]|nr:hypothetical protein [Azospirillum brasilense]